MTLQGLGLPVLSAKEMSDLTVCIKVWVFDYKLIVNVTFLLMPRSEHKNTVVGI